MAIVFFMTNTLMPVPSAHAQASEFLNPFSPFEIPAEWGRVTDLVTVPKSSSVLIHIQEAHANYDAQKNISNILRYLNENYGVKLILLEGAGNRLRPELFKFFPKDSELQAAVTQKLMEAGELTGAEVFLMDASQNSEGWGVEKAEAYAEDREAFKKVLGGQKIAEDFLASLYLEWQKQASLFLNKDLREFLARFSLFEEKKKSLHDWLKTLKDQSLKTLKIDLEDIHQQIEWPILVRYFRLKEVDSQINAAEVPKEINAFLGHIKTLRIPLDLLKQAEVFLRNGKNKELPAYKTRFVFERLLEALPPDYSFDAFPNLQLHIQQLILLSELQGDRLRSEARELTKRVVEALARTRKERYFTGLFREYQLLKRLFRLELDREEYQALKERNITSEKLVKDFRIKMSDLSKIRFLLKTAMRFYQGAVEREKWLIKNTFTRMKDRKQSRAVLITGGFHTDGLKEKALQGGSSYLQITPAIGEITPDTRKNYLTALLGQDAIAQSHLASIPTSDIVFMKKTTPDWRHFLAMRWARIEDIVGQIIVSMRPERSKEYEGTVAQALRLFTSDSLGIPAPQLQPAVSMVRSEIRNTDRQAISTKRPEKRSEMQFKILIADDSRSTCFFMKAIVGGFFTEKGYKNEVVLSENVEKAFEEYKAAEKSGVPFDLVISDWNMPNLNDGAELALRINKFDKENKKAKSAPIVFSSSNFSEEGMPNSTNAANGKIEEALGKMKGEGIGFQICSKLDVKDIKLLRILSDILNSKTAGSQEVVAPVSPQGYTSRSELRGQFLSSLSYGIWAVPFALTVSAYFLRIQHLDFLIRRLERKYVRALAKGKKLLRYEEQQNRLRYELKGIRLAGPASLVEQMFKNVQGRRRDAKMNQWVEAQRKSLQEAHIRAILLGRSEMREGTPALRAADDAIAKKAKVAGLTAADLEDLWQVYENDWSISRTPAIQRSADTFSKVFKEELAKCQTSKQKAELIWQVLRAVERLEFRQRTEQQGFQEANVPQAARVGGRAEVRAEPWNENLLIGAGKYPAAEDPSREKTSNWARINVLGKIILNWTSGHPEPLPLKDIQDIADKKFKARGLTGPGASVGDLLDRMVSMGLLRKSEQGYSLAVAQEIFAIKTNQIRFIKTSFELALQKLADKMPGAPVLLERLISGYNEAIAQWPRFPVEASWPVLKAIALMTPGQQEQLVNFLEEKKIKFTNTALAHTIELMLQKETPQNWLRKYTPNLAGRTIYYISPETWLAAGGLGRVGQYHTTALKKLVDGDAQVVTIEAYYPFRADKDGVLHRDVDYSKLPIPVENLSPEPLYEYVVRVKKGERRVNVVTQVFKGTNKYGIDCYFIKDKPEIEGGDEYYTKLLYKYGPDVQNAATWEEYAEFMSKASLKLKKRLEKERQEEQKEKYKPAIIWPNDGQMGPLLPFKRISDELDALPKEERLRLFRDPDFELADLVTDPETEVSLAEAYGHATTHTFNNRGAYKSWEFIHGMRIDPKWHYLFHRPNGYDSSSGLIRASDSANGVAAMHVQGIAHLDPENLLIAITNGDDLEQSSSVFRAIFENPDFYKMFPGADPWDPTPEQIVEAKKRAKILLSKNQALVALDGEFANLDPEKMVIATTGRLVPEKTGLDRAFTDANIEFMVRSGVQLVILGNIQSGFESRKMYEHLKELQARVNKIGPGRLIVATGWGIPEQRAVLSAMDVQVNDSHPVTEAAGFSETDAATNAALEITLPSPEGIYQQQGEVLDLEVPGSGNTILATEESEQGYRDAFRMAMSKYKNNRTDFAAYQVASRKLSRILKAELTAAAYLREFSKGIERTENPIDALMRFASGDQALGQFFKGEWLRAALLKHLQKDHTISFTRSENPNINAFAATDISGMGHTNIVAVMKGVQGQETTVIKGEEAFRQIFENLKAADEDRIHIRDGITGKIYGTYSVKELLERGLPIGLPAETHLQVLRVTLASKDLQDRGIKDASRSSLFFEPELSANIQKVILALLPQQLLERLGKKPEDMVWYSAQDGFFPQEKSPKDFTDEGFYLIVNKGGGRLHLTLTPSLVGIWNLDYQKAQTFVDRAYVHIALEVQGNTLSLEPGFGRIEGNGIHGDLAGKIFSYWIAHNLKPFARNYNFTTIRLNQFKTKDGILKEAGFELVKPATDSSPALWEMKVEPHPDPLELEAGIKQKTALDLQAGFLALFGASQSGNRESPDVRSEMRGEGEDFAELARISQEDINGESIANALHEAGHPVTFMKDGMNMDQIADRIRDNQVIYFSPALTGNYDYGKYKNQMIETAKTLIGPALQKIRQEEAGNGKLRQRKIFILRGMIDPGTSKAIYDTIKWNAHPPDADDYDFDLVFQPDFSFLESQRGQVKNPFVAFGLMKEDDGKNQVFQHATQTILNRIFGQFYKDKKIQFMHIRSAEMAREVLLVSLGAELAHFYHTAKLSLSYGADFNAAVFGAGLDKQIRNLLTDPSPGFGKRLFVYLRWMYAQLLHENALAFSKRDWFSTEQTICERNIEHEIQTWEKQWNHGESIANILPRGRAEKFQLEPQPQLLFVLKNILKIVGQNTLDNETGDHLKNGILIRDVDEYKKAIADRETRKQNAIAFRQKTVTMIGCGRTGLVTAASLSALGHKVHVVDIKAKQGEMDALNGPETVMPVYEPGLQKMIIEGKAKRLLTFSTDLETAVKNSSIVYLAVETASQKTGEIDLSDILKTFEDVGDVIKQYGGSKVIVIKSTVTPDAFKKTEEVMKTKGLVLGKDYALGSNPEFLSKDPIIKNVTNPDRTLLGFYAALSPENRAHAEKEILELWYPLMVKYPHPVILSDTASSAIAEYLANSFLAISITLSNLFAAVAAQDAADFMEVHELFSENTGIGKNVYFAPGVGCDVLSLHFSSSKNLSKSKRELSLIEIATEFNDHFNSVFRNTEKASKITLIKRYHIELANLEGWSSEYEQAWNKYLELNLLGKSVIVLGITSKPGTDDIRDAFGPYLLNDLLKKNAGPIILHDPILSMPNAPAPEILLDHFLDYYIKLFKDFGDSRKGSEAYAKLKSLKERPLETRLAYYATDGLYEDAKYLRLGRSSVHKDDIFVSGSYVVFEPDLRKLEQADIVYIATEWEQYKNIDLSRFKKPGRDLLIIDGRNLFYDRRDEIRDYAGYLGVGMPFLPQKETTLRSEIRASADRMISGFVEVKTSEEFFEFNHQKGGGAERGVRDVTVKIMGRSEVRSGASGICPLLAHLLNAPKMVFDAIYPQAYARDAFDMTTKPETFPNHAQFAAATVALGIKTLTAGDVLVLGRKFALDRGAIATVRTVFGDVPVLVYTSNEKDISFLKKLNVQLAQAQRPPILVVRSSEEAKKLLDREAGRLHKAGVSSVHFKAMVYETEFLPKALIRQLSDITVVNARMFKNFLALAGDHIHSLVQEIQQQFAFSRSA
ncbi:MAG: hypothetical protein WC530_04090 [Candidatus Omnitrophota bacterium]